ncbi:hypothetical protein PR003_g7375 [Phytophthora rubi]|uniref:Uncharacterized protein n=2 Tax=Phytophthora TaxID=4783 RepID=A0A6A3N0C2_9STRA|nr:hypothetical protein PR002_g7924 [Phytophthora rubi]KAE9346552.1 hypothetical protein PR003_g7375 [Phytophthora rubi]
MSSPSESSGGSTRPSACHVMERDLKPWDLYSLDGAEEPECLDVMKEDFTRYRQIRGKKRNNAYTHDALQRSRCAFIRRCNAGSDGLYFTSCGSKTVTPRAAHALVGIFVRACARWHSARGACATCTMSKVAPGAKII